MSQVYKRILYYDYVVVLFFPTKFNIVFYVKFNKKKKLFLKFIINKMKIENI